jgi:hypothetical protein
MTSREITNLLSNASRALLVSQKTFGSEHANTRGLKAEVARLRRLRFTSKTRIQNCATAGLFALREMEIGRGVSPVKSQG